MNKVGATGIWDFLTTAANDAGNVLSNVQSNQNYPVSPNYQSQNTYRPVYLPANNQSQGNTMVVVGLAAAALVLILLLNKK